MTRRVKEFIEIRDHSSLDTLIAQLSEIRDQLPEAAEAWNAMKDNRGGQAV